MSLHSYLLLHCTTGADAKARTRDGLTPGACIGLDSEAKRSKKVTQEDDELRAMLEDLENE